MSEQPQITVRRGGREDAETIGRLLHDFNAEFDEVTLEPAAIAERFRGPLAEDGTVVLLGALAEGSGADGIAVLRFREALCSAGLECYLAELYVVPALRGRGLGRRLLEDAIGLAREAGATYMDLGTSEDDEAARALYESCGFRNRESGPDGPLMYVYEREL